MTPSRRRAVFGTLLALWAATVWWLSSRANPGATLGLSFELADWLAHGIEFAAGGFCAYGLFLRGSRLRDGMLAVALCVVWGVVDEVHQSFVPGRFPDVFDVLADSVGAVLGTLLHVVLVSRRATVAGSAESVASVD